MNRIPEYLNKTCYKAEEKTNLLATSLLVGFGLLFIAMLYVCPSFTVADGGHGYYFSTLSEQPFDFSQNNPLRYRIFTPLLAYLLNIPKDFFYILPLIFAVLLIATVYYHYRKKQYEPAEAAGMSALIAFSSTVLIPIAFCGFTDTATYFFILLCFINVKRQLFFTLFFAMALFNHECTLFLWPALLLYSYLQNYKGRIKILTFLGCSVLVVAAYILYRTYIARHTAIEYDLSYYLSKKSILDNFYKILKLAPLGIFYAFKMFWFMPLVFFYLKLKEKKVSHSFVIFLIIGGAMAQLIIACDTTRLLALAFPAILLSADGIRNKISPEKFSSYIWILIILNLFIPQYYIIAYKVFPLFSPFIIFLSNLI